MERGNSRHGLKSTLQMLLLGLFISCFKQLYFGLAPSQALSAGITARCTGTICSAPRLAAQEVGAGQFGKSKRSFESLPARWKRCQSPSFNLEAEHSPSGRRERCQLVAPGAPPLPPEHGASAGCSCCGEGREERQSSFPTAGPGRSKHAGEGELSCGNAASVRAALCGDPAAAAASKELWEQGGGRCWAVPGSPAEGKGTEIPIARLSSAATSSRG